MGPQIWNQTTRKMAHTENSLRWSLELWLPVTSPASLPRAQQLPNCHGSPTDGVRHTVASQALSPVLLRCDLPFSLGWHLHRWGTATGLGVQHGARRGTQCPGSASPRGQPSRKGKHCRFHLSFLAEAVKLLAFKDLSRWVQPLSMFCVTEWKVLEVAQGLGKQGKLGNGPLSCEFIQLRSHQTILTREGSWHTRVIQT